MNRERPEVKLPLLLIGFKTYAESTGRRAMALAESAEGVARRTGVTIVPIVQFTDIQPVATSVAIPVFAQHIDPIEPGSHTGQVLPEAVKEAGAAGSLINHSERRLAFVKIRRCVERAREVGLLSCVCSDSPQASRKIARLGPDLMLVENPELIGTGRAISSADPEVLSRSLDAVRDVNPGIHLVCGAGIGNRQDVERAVSLGMSGVGAASSIVRAPDPARVIYALADALLRSWSGKRMILDPGSAHASPRLGSW